MQWLFSMQFSFIVIIFLHMISLESPLEAAFAPLDLLPQIVQEEAKEQEPKTEKLETTSETQSALPEIKEIIDSEIHSQAPQNKKPLRHMLHVSRMPHIPLQKPLELQDRGMFMSHPHPQQPTLPDSAVFPPTTKKNTG